MVSFQIPFLQRQLPVEIETERLGGGIRGKETQFRPTYNGFEADEIQDYESSINSFGLNDLHKSNLSLFIVPTLPKI